MKINAIKSHLKQPNSKKIKANKLIVKNNTPQLSKSKRVNPQQFTKKVLSWFQQHGRKNLPWQHNISPYRVWISEIMLQQTQVQTVIPYFNRFMQRFPRIADLANAAEDEVLHLWTGLGYYARARHLHKTAKIIQQQFNGKFPRNLTTLQTLPGIGRSTAGAICAIAMKQPAAILDGNVKRVLARVHAIAGWPGQSEVAAQLWQIAEQYTPQQNAADYTQAMMDIGALICTRSKPQCTSCPLQTMCVAYLNNCTTDYPGKKPAKKIPVRSVQVLILCKENHEVLLIKRPAKGIWGGLWSLPECPSETDIKSWCQQQYSFQIKQMHAWPAFRHTFTHFHLDITPVIVKVNLKTTIKNLRTNPSMNLSVLAGEKNFKKSRLNISSVVTEANTKVTHKNLLTASTSRNKTTNLQTTGNKTTTPHETDLVTPPTWYNIKKPDERGLAAPIKQLLLQLATLLEEEKHGTNHSLREIA